MNIQSQTVPPSKQMSVEAFFRWSETQERKYELVDGIAQLQPWVKKNHNRITVNIVMALGRQIDPTAFEIATGDFAVQTGPKSIRYADVMVEVAGGPGELRIAETAIVLVEVLSKSTAHIDFGAKLREYQALSSLDTYLIVAEDSRTVWRWTRRADGLWPDDPIVQTDPDSVVPLEAVGAELSFSDIYRNVG